MLIGLVYSLLSIFTGQLEIFFETNMETMNALWIPPIIIEALYHELHKAKGFAQEADEVIIHNVPVRTSYKILNISVYSRHDTRSGICYQRYIKHGYILRLTLLTILPYLEKQPQPH